MPISVIVGRGKRNSLVQDGAILRSGGCQLTDPFILDPGRYFKLQQDDGLLQFHTAGVFPTADRSG